MHNSRFRKKYSTEKKTGRGIKIFLSIFLFFVFSVGAVSLLRMNFMQIKNFEFLGENAVLEEDLALVASSIISGNKLIFIPNSNKLFLDEENLSKGLKEKFGRLSSVEVDSNIFGSTAKIKVTEREPGYIWCSASDSCFFMDKEGLIFEKVDPGWLEAYGDMVVFEGGVSGDPIGKFFASKNVMDEYTGFVNSLNSAGVSVSLIKIESGNKAIADSNVGLVIFNPEEPDFKYSARNVILLIKDERAKNPGAIFEYIDARFGNKMFYKTIER